MSHKKPEESSQRRGKKAFLLSTFYFLLRRLRAVLPKNKWLRRLEITLIILVAAALSGMYGIALWYQHSQKGKPQVLGVSFIADYASSLGLDAHTTYDAILNDLHVKHLRLVSYWNDIEPTAGAYDFSELDYEMTQAQIHGAKVTLAIGLRQPRWPECHAPGWIDTSQAGKTWEPQLESYMAAVIARYKHNSALESYQLENEFFNTFGQCDNHDRGRLDRELAMVKKLDPSHSVIISRSDNYVGFSLSRPLPDEIGISVYRRVWNTFLVHRYFEYPFPSWYYAFLAGTQQILTGKPSVLHELQAEPWPPNGQSILDTSLKEQNKTFDAARLKSTVKFGEQTGLKQIDLWGAEYWYYRAHILHDPSVWNAAENIFRQ